MFLLLSHNGNSPLFIPLLSVPGQWDPIFLLQSNQLHFFWMSNQPSFHFPGCLVQILVLLPHIHLPLIFPPLIICSKSGYLSALLPGSNFHSVVKVGGHTYRARTQPHQTLKRGRHAERRIETDMSFNGNRRSPFVFSHWLFQKQNSQFSLFNTERVFAKVISSLYDVHVWW